MRLGYNSDDKMLVVKVILVLWIQIYLLPFGFLLTKYAIAKVLPVCLLKGGVSE